MTATVIAVPTIRYRCSVCGKSYASKTRTARHAIRCIHCSTSPDPTPCASAP